VSTTEPFLIRKILVAVDASPGSVAALRAAVELAARAKAELLGLFVEDVALLRLAEAPLAREIQSTSAGRIPMTRSRMEFNIRAQSQLAQDAMAATAQGAQITWSFRTVRGQVTKEILTAAGEADLLVLGAAGWSIGAWPRLGSTAQRAVISSKPVLLLPLHALPSYSHVMVYFDDTPAAQRALLVAAELAEICSGRLTVLIAAADRKEKDRISEEVTSTLQDRAIEVTYRAIDSRDQGDLRNFMLSKPGGILVLGGPKAARTLETLASLMRETNMPLLLLDGE
jgi:nucleotide-binding universal stress UspA family protein